MTSRQVIMITRWLLVPVAAAMGVIGAILPSFVVNGIVELLLSRDHYVPGAALVTYYTLPICGAFAACFFVLFGTRAAPTHRFIVSIILLIIGGSLAWYCVGTMYEPASFAHRPEGQPQVRVWQPIIATYSGGVAACIMVYFRASLRRVFRFRRFK